MMKITFNGDKAVRVTKERIAALGLVLGVFEAVPKEIRDKQLAESGLASDLIEKTTNIAFDIHIHAYTLQKMLEKKGVTDEEYDQLFYETVEEVTKELTDQPPKDQLAELLPSLKKYLEN